LRRFCAISKAIDICKNAPLISQFYSAEAKTRFDEILNKLTKFGIVAPVNSRLVRGLDYYTSTVFEFTMPVEGAQNAVLAGGRYDNLVEKMGGKSTPAIGFAAGIERLMLLTKIGPKKPESIAIIYVADEQKSIAFEIAQNLRNQGLVVDFVLDGNFKKQMKKAGQNNARFLLIIGEDEIKNNAVSIKDSKTKTEEKISIKEIAKHLQQKL